MKMWKKRLIAYGLVGTGIVVAISSHYYPWIGPAALITVFSAVGVYIIEDIISGRWRD